jgi:hypothetical protein
MKKYILNVSIAFCLLAIVCAPMVFNSCRKTNNDTINDLGRALPEPDAIMSYFRILSTHTDGAFGLKSFGTTETSESTIQTAQIGGSFADQSGRAAKGGIVQIGQYKLESNPAHNFMYGFDRIQGDELYGKNVAFRLEPPRQNVTNVINGTSSGGGSGSPDFVTDTLYVPQKVALTIPAKTSIKSGYTIAWNADNKNQKGMVITIQYDTSVLENKKLLTTSPKPLANAITTKDVGGYELTSADLSIFPVGAVLKVMVGRANYNNTTVSDGRTYTIYAYTIANVMMVKSE